MARLRLSAMAQADIVNALTWTTQRFGAVAQERYEQLLSSAFAALLAEPARIGSIARPELGDCVRSFHLRYIRRQSSAARPRHLILYGISDAGTVEVGRVLHDAMELDGHVQLEVPPEP